jgi:uroporphyrinogen decarboxylase
MNPRENAIRNMRFDRPDRITGGLPCHSIGYHGADHEGYAGGGHHLPVGSKWTDIWGTEWHLEHAGVMGFPRGNPLADLPRTIGSYNWPDPDDERIVGCLAGRKQGWDPATQFLSGSHRDTLWEKTYMLVGMENAMCFFHTDPEAMRELLHRIMDFQLGIAKHYLELGVEAVFCGDDLGTQCGLLLSPDIVHEFLVPEYRRLFSLYKAHDVIIWFHSCGHIEPLLETFIALGIDILDPIQATANNLDRVRQVTQGRMALQGGVSSSTLMNGPVEAIRDEVRQRIRQLGANGGYFCSPDQWIPWPEEHYTAYRAAVEEGG